MQRCARRGIWHSATPKRSTKTCTRHYAACSNIFRRTGTRAGDADRVDLAVPRLVLGLNPDLVFPQIAQIVLVADPLAHAQLEIGERHLTASRIAVALASPSRTIVPAVQPESMEMVVLLAECDPDCSVQRVERHFLWNEQPAPNHRRDSPLAHFAGCLTGAS